MLHHRLECITTASLSAPTSLLLLSSSPLWDLGEAGICTHLECHRSCSMHQVGGRESSPNTSSHLSTLHYTRYYLPELVISSSPLLDPGEAGINHPECHLSSQFQSQTLLSRHRQDTRVISKINKSKVPPKLKCKARFWDHHLGLARSPQVKSNLTQKQAST